MDDPARYRCYLGEEVTVTIDRPLGSRHPTHGFEYTSNYGYLPGTRAGDGHEIDAYVLGIRTPLETFTGRCIAIILRRDDDEHKLVVSEHPLSKAAIAEATRFVEHYYDTTIVLAEDVCHD